MTKKVDINEVNAKKYAQRKVIQFFIVRMFNIALLFIPVGERSMYQNVTEVIHGAETNTVNIASIIGLVLVILCIVFEGIKIITFKNKTEINTESPDTILKSPFVKFFQMNVGMIEVWIFMLYVVVLVTDSSFDWSTQGDNVMQLAWCVFAVSVINLILNCILMGGMSRAIAELSVSVKSAHTYRKAANDLGINVGDRANGKSEARSYRDQKSNLDALLKYKKLYENGAITEGEYNAKKDELLNK